MSVDLNKVAQKLKQERNVGVTRDGRITDRDPNNDGTRESASGTTLKPQRFFA